MGWQEEDRGKRAKIAHELDRREFWKSCFKISASSNEDIGTQMAAEYADAALSEFELRFPPLHGVS